MTPTGTAIALGNGPFEGFMPEVLTTHYELRLGDGDEHGRHIVVSNLPEDSGYEAETCVFVAHEDGSLDIGFYVGNNGALFSVPGDIRADDLMESLGYEVIK